MVKGKQELEDWRKTHVLLTRKQAIRAFCCDCMSEFVDDKDCKNMNCPLYPYMPYSSYVEPDKEK